MIEDRIKDGKEVVTVKETEKVKRLKAIPYIKNVYIENEERIIEFEEDNLE